MVRKLLAVLNRHLHNNTRTYLGIVLLFTAGVVLGAWTSGRPESIWQPGAERYLENFVREIANFPVADSRLVAQESTWRSFKLFGAIWFLGLTVIGIPVVLLLVLLKGFALGFTVGFVVRERGLEGLFLSLGAVLPQNILLVPGLLMVSVLAVGFSLWLVKGHPFGWRSGLLVELGCYFGWFVVPVLLAGMGGVVEGYLGPALVKVFLG